MLNISGDVTPPPSISFTEVKKSVRSLSFFDKLYQSEVCSQSGCIKGCFDETFDGIVIGDLLREFLMNEESENKHLFSAEEKSEFIFKLLKILSIGGYYTQVADLVFALIIQFSSLQYI